MGKTKAPYPAEFKEEAVRLVKSSGRPVAQMARELGVSFESLRHWIEQSEIDNGERQGLTGDEREELTKLRREVKVLQQEREILKKAAAFFAREGETRWAYIGSSRGRRLCIRSRRCVGYWEWRARATMRGGLGASRRGPWPTPR